jgi:hypothetical protein
MVIHLFEANFMWLLLHPYDVTLNARRVSTVYDLTASLVKWRLLRSPINWSGKPLLLSLRKRHMSMDSGLQENKILRRERHAVRAEQSNPTSFPVC